MDTDDMFLREMHITDEIKYINKEIKRIEKEDVHYMGKESAIKRFKEILAILENKASLLNELRSLLLAEIEYDIAPFIITIFLLVIVPLSFILAFDPKTIIEIMELGLVILIGFMVMGSILLLIHAEAIVYLCEQKKTVFLIKKIKVDILSFSEDLNDDQN